MLIALSIAFCYALAVSSRRARRSTPTSGHALRKADEAERKSFSKAAHMFFSLGSPNAPSLLSRPLASISLRQRCTKARAQVGDQNPALASVSDAQFADTIFALSSGAGVRAGVSVVRISGPHAKDAVLLMAPGKAATLPEPRKAVLRNLRTPGTHELIDQVLVLWFPGPRSFTGEDTVELHTHGSRAVIAATLEALGSIPGLRMAERGEFTRQAFENGRMDLTEVEGLSDLINADTEEQRKQALRQMGGAQRKRCEAWRHELLNALAHTEALIDFGEDADDITSDALRGAIGRTSKLLADIELNLDDGNRGEVVREGVRVAILGPPNAGKSTLLNILAQRPAAIVSNIAGTTRDVVSVTLELGGLPVLVSDTAGLREHTNDPIEMQGMLRAADEARKSQIQLWVFDAASPPEDMKQLSTDAGKKGCSGMDGELQQASLRLLVLNKVDLLSEERKTHVCDFLPPSSQWKLSCESGQGLQPFLDSLAALVASKYGSNEAEPALITRARHREHLRRCADALRSFEMYAALAENAPLDLAAEELRIAADELGQITGQIDVEELLDVIFRDFCIGK